MALAETAFVVKQAVYAEEGIREVNAANRAAAEARFEAAAGAATALCEGVSQLGQSQEIVDLAIGAKS